MSGRTNGHGGGAQEEEGDIPVRPGQQGGSNGHGAGGDEDRMGGGAPAGDDDD